MSAGIETLSKERLAEDYAETIYDAYESMRGCYKRRSHEGLNQDKIAALLGIDKSLVSKRLNGQENLTLKSLCAIGSAMDCRVTVHFRPFESLGFGNNHWSSWQAGPPEIDPIKEY